MNRIKQLRKEKGLSIDTLSKELKKNGYSISPASISKYEREQRNPKIQSWEALANFFNVSVPYVQGISDEKSTENSSKSVASTISTIHEILLYLGRHAGTGYIPESIKNGLVFSRKDDIRLQDILMRLINSVVNLDSDDYLNEYDTFVKKISKKVMREAEEKGIAGKEVSREDVSDVINQYYLVVNDYLFNLKTADDVIDNTIHGLSYLIEQLNIEMLNKDEIKQRYIRDEDWNITKMVSEPLEGKLPQNINRKTYLKINNTLNKAINELLALRKSKPTSPTFFVK